ncbi:MAG: hypothetical protein ABEJ91_02300 [Candidatus Nanohaloarchaea archaeon]
MRRKGTGAGIIAILGLFLMTNFFLVDVTVGSLSFGQELEESVSDLGKVADAKSRAHNYLYNVLPMGASYSLQQTAFQLGKDGGGVSWSNDDLSSSDRRTDRRTDVNGLETLKVPLNQLHPDYRELLTRFREGSRQFFNENYVGRYTGNCEPRTDSFSLELRPYTMGVARGVFENDEPLRLTCDYAGGSLKYVGDSGSLEVPFRARKNRYLMLAEGGLDIALSIKQELSSISDRSFSSTKEQCGGGYRTASAKKEATGSMNSTVKSKYSTAVSNFPKVSSFKMNDTNRIEVTGFSISTSKSSRGCSCEDEDDDGDVEKPEECDKTWYRVTATSVLKEAQSVIVLKDSKYRVPTSEGWKKLFIWIEPYTHRF